MKNSVKFVCAFLSLALVGVGGAEAATRKQELSLKETFSPEDAAKGQVYLDAAMTTPMEVLLKGADAQHPANMFEYGLALYLGRPSVAMQMNAGDKEKLKTAYRGVLDLYLNSSDKFGKVNFDEDEMLDNGDFWVYLAEHIGRPKTRQELNTTVTVAADQGMGPGGGMLAFIPDNQNTEFNLNQDLVLRRQVVNAATTCATSAASFARMKKAQTVDIAETKLAPDKFAEMKTTATRLYRAAYDLGGMSCPSKAYFQKAASFAAQNLGKLGALKDDPAAIVATLSEDTKSQ